MALKTRKLRKFRVKNPENLGLEIGKLYKFKGKFRKLYNNQTNNKQNVNYINRNTSSKIRKNDFVMFFAADLWRTSSLKKRFVRVKDLEKVKKNLEKEGKLPKKYFRKPASSKEDKQNEKRPEIKSLEETLMQQLGFLTELDIDEAGMGKITIHIQSYEDLDEFFHKIIAMMDPIVVSEE